VNDYLQGTYLPQDAVRLSYFGWDKQKTRGCVCDPEYGDVDCSKRMCPYGTDVMDNRDDMSNQAKFQVQKFKFVTRPYSSRNVATSTSDNVTNIEHQTFALTFKSKLNESFTTRPIAIETDHFGAVQKFNRFLLSVQEALMSLPNQVIDKVEVHGAVDTLANYGKNIFLSDNYTSNGENSYTDSLNGNDLANVIYLNISFVGEHTQGPQHLLTVKDIVCGDGCTPQLTGLELAYNTQNSTEIQLSDFNSFECGRRGKCDYTTGICGCFSGFTGLSCGTINALV